MTVVSDDERRPEARPGWRGDLDAVQAGVRRHRIPLIAAGIAFYCFLALVPTLVVVVSLYGLFASPADVRSFVEGAMRAAPPQARELVVQQLEDVTRSSTGGSVTTALVAAALAAFSASSAVAHLVDGIALAFDRPPNTSAVKRRARALGLTALAAGFGATALFVIAVLPAVLADADVPVVIRWLVGVLRWPVLGLAMVSGLDRLYRRIAPGRPGHHRLGSPGAVVAMLLWLLGSAGFALYTANVSRFQATYGSLGAVVVFLLWLLLTAASVLIGAEVDRARDLAVGSGEGRAR